MSENPTSHTRSAGKLTAVGAISAFILAGTAVPASAAEAPGNCNTSPTGKVTCVYDKPVVSHYTLRIPTGVTEVHIDARGAAGGDGGTINPRKRAVEGAPGGFVAATFPVAAGDVLRVLVGGHGGDADGIKAGEAGRNGGGPGGPGAPAGGGGGGGSSVRLNGKGEDSRILVAGGGGGAGGAVTSTAMSLARGGAGGGDRGQDGSGDTAGPGGIGAVGPSGGAGLMRVTGLDGTSGYDADHGGEGGEGGYGASHSVKHSGTCSGGPVGAGGGGGGYAGGGGGAAGATIGGGGGGGSGFVATSFLAPAVARLGSTELLMGKGSYSDGLVVITYQLPAERHSSAASAASAARSSHATAGERERG
jgi:hypothetical protein